jgi:hypothetical protein
MRVSNYWMASGVVAALALIGVVSAAGSAPPPETSASKPIEVAAEEEPVPLLPKDRTGVWRSVVISKSGNRIDRYTIHFVSGTELVWEWHRREPGVDGQGGTRYKYAVSAAGKLELTSLATLMEDGLEWDPQPGRKRPSVEYTILPLDKRANSFQLVQLNARGQKVFDTVFRHEPEAPLAADPLVPDYLTKIDRTIKREPKYVNAPKYVLLVFGPKAEFKVWIAIDGDTAYIDRNGNGDLTEEGELCKPASTEKNVVRQASGELTYRLPGTRRTIANVWWFHSEQDRTGGFVGVSTDNHMSQTGGGHGLNYSPSTGQAAVIHFGSDVVSIQPQRSVSLLREGTNRLETFSCGPDANAEAWVVFKVGTPGVGAGNRRFGAATFAAFAHTDTGVIRKPVLIPKGVHPIADYEFGPLKPTDGVKLVTVKLDQLLGQNEFAGKITVPEGVKTGLDAAKVTLSYPNCPWGKVEPVTYLVDVIPRR